VGGQLQSIGGFFLAPLRHTDSDEISRCELSRRFEYLAQRALPDELLKTPRIVVEAGYHPLWDQDWLRVERLILKEARRQRDEIRRRYSDAGAILQDTEPQISTHVRWLFLRICPQDDVGRPWG